MTLSAGPAGQTCFAGDIVDDELALEPVEEFTLRLRDPAVQNVLVGNDETIVRIIDDDGEYLCIDKVYFIYNHCMLYECISYYFIKFSASNYV